MGKAADVYVVDLICGLLYSTLNESLYVRTMHAVLAQEASAYVFFSSLSWSM